jgi:hypothetical protein
MSSSRALVRRRELLSALGASAFLAVPVFRQSLAEAQGSMPKRAIFVQWPGGVPSRCYQLGECGGDLPDLAYFNFDGQLAAFSPLKNDTILFRNLRFASAERNSAEGHEAGMVGLLTGASSRSGNITSVDQHIASAVGNLTRFSSFQFGANPWPGATPQDRVSYKDGFAFSPERDPATIFQTLFGDGNIPSGGQSAPDPAVAKRLEQRKSILDFLKGEIGAVQGLTGSVEKPILDVHLESLRELEKQATQGAAAAGTDCAAPDLGGVGVNHFRGDGVEPDIQLLARLQLDLLYQAINCDLTRVATFQFAASVEVDAKYSWVPGYNANPDQHHGFQHDHESVENEAIFRGIQTWFTDQIAGLAARMKATSEGGGSLLDNSVVMLTSEMSNGIHIHSPLPVLLIGRGNGTFQKLGQTLDAGNKAHNDLLVALAQYMGAGVNSVGIAELNQGALAL